MRIDIMCDIETLGTKVDSTIIQIAAIAFDIKTGKHLKRFNEVADIARNKNPLTVDGSTLKWWLNTDKELLTKLLNAGEFSSEDVLLLFWHWLNGLSKEANIFFWGNGIMFDNNMIKHQLEANDLNYPVPYYNDRDVRTIVELASDKLGISQKKLKQRYEDESFVKHDAYDDVRFQIALVHGCYDVLTKSDVAGESEKKERHV